MKSEGNEPREYTEEEVRQIFLNTVRGQIRYWAEHPNPYVADGETEVYGRVSGLAHSMLALLDGNVGMIPGFKVVPNPHAEDKEYHINRRENWYPDDVDIAGSLHEQLFRP